MKLALHLSFGFGLGLIAAEPVTPAAAGNAAVAEIMKNYAGRGTLADDTPMRSPSDALKSFKLRGDVGIDLVLHEPAVEQPLYMSFDSRGRLWVTQYRQYQFPAGLRIISYDQHLRAQFDQVPEPPPQGVKGADRVTVHEDTDGDGLYDSSKVVIDGLNIATAAIKGAGGIWVMNAPYLLFYPDANDDDVPDGDPSVELKGFGIEDTHSVANSLCWGVDGWLYGVNGSTTTGNVSSAATKNLRWEGQCVWRFHPASKKFEIYAEGGGNTFSLDIDSKGRVFSGTNGGNTRGMHYEQGSYGIKGWGKHGPLTNPYAFGWFEHMAHEGDNKRFPQAFTIYEGGLLGSAYEGRIIAPNALHNLVYLSERQPLGATFKTKDTENLVTTDDRWFRPVDAKSGPDGCVYMADWYDTRLSHVRPVDDWHKTSGRIYRIRPASGAPVLKKMDLHTASAEDLLGQLSSTNKWMRKQAVMEIGWRKLDELIPRLTELVFNSDDSRTIDALFALDQINALGDAQITALLEHSDPYVRRWTVKMIGEKGGKWDKALAALPALATREQQPEVLTQIAASAKRIYGGHSLPVMKALALKPEPVHSAAESRLPLMLWWALENKAETHRDAVVAMFADKALWAAPLAKAAWLKQLPQRWALAGDDANLQACTQLLARAPDEAGRALVISGLAAALEGTELPKLPDALAAALKDYLKEQGGDDLALGLRSGDKAVLKEALTLLKDNKATVSKRASVALLLAEIGNKDALTAVEAVYKGGGNEVLKRALLPAVTKFGDHKIVTAILDGWEQRIAGDKALRETALKAFASNEDWSRMLMGAVDRWRIPAKHFSVDIVRQLSLHKNTEIDAAIERHWKGLLAVAPTAEIQKEAGRLTAVLKAGSGDATKGKAHFTARCAICHQLFGQGNQIGPDLTGYERGNLHFWLDAILTPSLEIREGFGNYVVKLKNGQVLMGIIAKQDATGVQLRDAANQVAQVKPSDIASMEASPISLMPPMLTTGMTDTDLRDLFAYLMHLEGAQ